MKWVRCIAAGFLLFTPVFAESWSGVLVDSKCYASEEANVNPFEPYHDQALEVRYCRPNAHTKSFAIIQADWQELKLDFAANAKAAELAAKANKKQHYIGVVVTGEKTKDTLTVNSISPAR